MNNTGPMTSGVSPLDWALLGLAVIAAVYVLILFVRYLIDSTPSWSYKIRFEPVGTSAGGTGVGETRGMIVNFTVWNRTSQDATFQCGLMVPLERTPKESRWQGLRNLRMVDAATTVTGDMRGFVVKAGNGRRFSIQGEAFPGTPDPTLLEFSIRDDRIGRRSWKLKRDLPVPPFPTFDDLLRFTARRP